MSFERMPGAEPEHEPEKEAVSLPKKKGVLSKFTDTVKTTIGLGAAIVGIGMAEGNFDAQAADSSRRQNAAERSGRRLNDHEREEHFYEFNNVYTEGVRAFKKAKDRESGEHAAFVLDTAIGFLKASEWKRAGNTSSLDNRFLKCLKYVEEMYLGLERQYGISFATAARRTTFELACASFMNRLDQNALAAKIEKEKDTGDRRKGSSVSHRNMSGVDIRIGRSSSGGGSYRRLTPNRPRK